MKASSPTSFERMSPGGGASTITTTMLATTPTTSSTVSTPLSSPMYFLPATSPADQQRAIAAAAAAALARRKRRKALARRSLRNRQTRVKVTPIPTPATEVSKRPLSPSKVFATEEKPEMIQPTVHGMQQVASKLFAGHVVAIPTECTYELVMQLTLQEASTWSDRIQLLKERSIATTHPDKKEREEEEGEEEDACQPTNKKPRLETSDQPLKRPVSSVSISSTGSDECNNKSHHNVEPIPTQIPHVYLHPTALDNSPFWKKCFPKRPYAVRNKEGEVLAAHAFNETHQLLRLMAGKVWPGPVVIHVQVVNDSLPSPMTITRDGKQYIALRSLCHPLTVKVYQEYHQQAANENTPQQSKTNDSDVNTKNHSLLIGMPLQNSRSATSPATYITAAAQVVEPGIPVLNGEERREIFAVPPCEYGQPSSTAIWLDAQRRMVILSSMAAKATGSQEKPLWTRQQLLQALHSRCKLKTDKDRVILAVLNQWDVVEESNNNNRNSNGDDE